jgi:Ca2+-binding RTX toxin-like protein
MTLLLAALVACLLAAAPAQAANVALFNDPTYVGGGDEPGNITAAMTSQGHTVTPFADHSGDGFRAALVAHDTLVIPDLAGASNLHTALTGDARETIRQFVEGGGSLVINGHATGSKAAALINAIFNFDVTEASAGGAAKVPEAAAGTEFAGGPDELAANDFMSGLGNSSLPAGARIVYQSGPNATVAVLYRGLGSITYLGWDWHNSNPPEPGLQDGGWQGILNSAIVRPTVSIADAGVLEGDSGVTPAHFAISLAGGPVSEEVRVTIEAGGGTATGGQDYAVPPTTVTIPRGATQANLDVAVIGDTTDEGNESFEIRALAATGANIGRGTALGTIGDDDPTPGRCKNRQDANDTGGTLNGTPFGDLLVGGAGKDVLNGADGEDCLRGRGGNDRLNGGDDGDSLSGEDGSDKLSGGAGGDTLSGGNGGDTLSGGDGNDRLGGGAGDDKINGGQGLNTYSGGSGNDNIMAANGRRETIDCGSGRKDKARVDRTDTVRNCESVARL